jgi:hypothetical protein
MFCWSCSGGIQGSSPRNIVHEFKTIHLNIDAVGDVVVAEGIHDMMKRNGLLEGMKATKEIRKPDPMRIDTAIHNAPLTVSKELGALV